MYKQDGLPSQKQKQACKKKPGRSCMDPASVSGILRGHRTVQWAAVCCPQLASITSGKNLQKVKDFFFYHVPSQLAKPTIIGIAMCTGIVSVKKDFIKIKKWGNR